MAESHERALARPAEPWERLGVRGGVLLVSVVAALAWAGWFLFIRHEVPGLADARDRWSESGYADYEMRYSIGSQSGAIPATVVVRDGRFESITWDDRVSERGSSGWTVEDLFDVIDDRDTASATFHAVTGHPLSAFFDPDGGTSDDEWSISVESVRPLDEAMQE